MLVSQRIATAVSQRGRALQLNPHAWARLAANHATVSWLEVQSDGLAPRPIVSRRPFLEVKLREFGSSGHLPVELQTY